MSIAYLNNSKEIDDHIESLNVDIGYLQTAIRNYTPGNNNNYELEDEHPLINCVI